MIKVSSNFWEFTDFQKWKTNRTEEQTHMKRRSLSVLLAGLLAVSPVCQNAYGAESAISDAQVAVRAEAIDFEYVIWNGVIVIDKYIGSDASIVIPDKIDDLTVEYIHSGAFEECENLEEIVLPSGLKNIMSYTFGDCKKLKKIYISKNVEKIEREPFSGCENLLEITVDDANNEYCSIDGVLFTKDKKTLLKYPAGRPDKSYTVPDTVTEIAENAFKGCSNLEYIHLPETPITIGNGAFQDCISLKKIKFDASFPGGCWAIFSNCKDLENIEIQEGVGWFGWHAFYGCTSLKTMAFPESCDDFDYCFGDYGTNDSNWPQLESVLFLCSDADLSGSGLKRDVVIYAPRGGLTEEMLNAWGWEFHDPSEYLAQPILSDVSGTDSTITLTWEPVNRAQGYYVYRKFDGSDWEQIGEVSEPDITSYTDETAVAGTNYTYTACAYTVAGSFLGPRDETGKTARIPVALKLEAQTGGINVTTTDEILTPDTRLVADRVSTSVKDLINADFVGMADYDWRSAVLYDIYLEKDGQKVQPNGEVTVSIPVPDTMNGEQCSVLYIDDAGNVVDMKAVYLDGYMVFTTNHFSHYALVEVATGVEVSGTITSYGAEDGMVTISLLDGDTEVESVENTDSTYTFASVPFGTYTLQVSKENHVIRTYDITVSDETVTQDVKICLIGDVTGDGKVNTRDLNRLYAHVNGTNPLTGYEFACGDVTGDGKINTRDLNRLYAHISETNLLW